MISGMPSTFSSLHCHIVFGTKNRQPWLIDAIRPQVHEYLGGCFRTAGALPLEIGGVADHVHALVRFKPTHCIADLLRDVKKASSDWIARDRRFAWQDGYAAFTVARSQIDAVRQYIANQEEHHRRRSFLEEYREFLVAHGIEFEERFLL
jgi:putative transposase